MVAFGFCRGCHSLIRYSGFCVCIRFCTCFFLSCHIYFIRVLFCFGVCHRLYISVLYSYRPVGYCSCKV
ncbi:hypothetical protein 2200_scaffold2352_00053 [Bacteriophage sp.]|nr:hypothetical protein 2200_scaffold2352_00053 [Bacteriophage sp.]